MRAGILTLFIATFISCTSSATSKGNNETIVEVIPIHVSQPEPGIYKAEVDVVVDGHKKRFILDSGARKTSVGSDEDTQPYPAVGQDQSGGAFGKVVALDIIQPRKLELGPHVFLNPRLQRTATNRNFNLLGIDLLAENPFQVDLKNAKLNLMAGFSSASIKKPIHRLSPGHIAVPITLGKKESFALFDTGAERTSIDLQFVKDNPQLFKPVGTARGSDSIAQQKDTPIYQVSSVAIGNLQLNNVEMAAFDFGDDFRKKMEGVPVILGNNVIYQAKWSFDVKQGLWAVEPYMSLDQSKPAQPLERQELERQEKTFDMQWQRSLPVDQSDTGIGIIGGTEVRSLVSMNGKLYAGIGYWSDAKEDDPQLPGGQVLVLDSPASKWKVDLSLDERVKSGPQAGKRRYFAIAMLYGATFKSDLEGHALAKPVQMLLAGVWDRLGQLQVLSKTAESKSWSTTDISENHGQLPFRGRSARHHLRRWL